MSKPAALLLAMLISVPVNAAENSLGWPRFRGPNGSGIAMDEKPPIDIGPGQECEVESSGA